MDMRKYLTLEKSAAPAEKLMMNNIENNGAPYHLVIKIVLNGKDKIKNTMEQKDENYLHEKSEDGKLISPVLPEGIKNYL